MTSERIAFAKVRARIRRENTRIEDEEHEGGEINLVPYLDIITNTVIFLLATTASIVPLANINVTAPRYANPGQMSGAAEESDKPPLNLNVTVSYTGFIIAGSGAVLPGDDGKLPTIKCRGGLKKGRCPAYLGARTTADGTREPVWVDRYDYDKLRKRVKDVKEKYRQERQVILMADRSVPYQVVVKAMDTLRGNPTEKCTGKDDCFFDRVILSAGLD